MGAVVSRWRAKPSTVEVLEGLDKDVQALEEYREKNQRQLKLWLYRLVLYSVLLYFVASVVIYVWYIPELLIGKLIVASPFLIFPLLIWLLRKLLIVLDNKRTERNNERLEELKAEKKKILEQVMETETYKNAKLILERFDPESKQRLTELETQPIGPLATPRQGQELRQRHVTPRPVGRPPAGPATAPAAPLSAPGGPPEKGLSASTPQGLIRRPGTPAGPATPVVMGMHPPGPPLARPILPRERGAMDRVVEYLVGDGPQNRYALICQQCLSHNGMALKEEFEYIAFRCAYCYFLNPARRMRPQAPRLPESTAETKMSQDPPAVAMETDLSGSSPAPEGKAASPGHLKAECADERAEVIPSEEKPILPEANTSLPDKSDGELDVSAMEVE
ncbi:Endoplasmic reticulum junction formation protein lunapark-A [Triplophysa tibetana]|uniref:Endoplasmic reticulum junction formation protein lunapark n=1 Tax=Triplophysa tibetana TaxID=1572043 RepID=A0A5A9P2T7_9TELE|nr:Endoplasmic reticulum junction formation protein lunapark-A [Triplophysa tibetana]